jgi:hypothetical protein
VRTEGEFASAWASLAIDDRKRHSMGRAARERALQLHWSAAVDGFSLVADEALARARVASQGTASQARASQSRASQNRASQNRADAGADEPVVADAVGYLAQPSGPAPPEPM